MLQGAKRLGGVNSFLVVGINSDNSIRDLKGENRPVIEENDRLECVRALGCVDYGFIFDSTDFSPFISKAKDCLYVKGSDYLKITQAEEDALKLSGGRWKTVDSGNKNPTSKIIEKIKKNS
jgi:D-beta-D-heptose 7-phosphate kinase/D-beta-D-heptose 1-phosphate adenosyltransferase